MQQRTYERITIPKIVVCTKSTVDDCADAEDCDKRLPGHRKMVRSRSRRHSRRFSTNIIERRSPSSSRSPSPSFLRSQDQDREARIEPNDKENSDDRDGNSEKGKENCLSEAKEPDEANSKPEKDDTVERWQNGFLEGETKEESTAKPEDNVDEVKSSNNMEPCKSKHPRCSKCTRAQNNKEEACLNNCSGYQQYLRLLEVPQANLEWGEGSGDDLSSEWDSDYTDRTSERTAAKVTNLWEMEKFWSDVYLLINAT